MIYEVINPSDCCTFDAPDHEVATLAVFMLGEGHYGGQSDEGPEVPIFLFGGATEWYQKTFGHSFEDGLTKRRADVAVALGSLIYCDASNRKAVVASGGDIHAFNDAKRTSMNNIGKRAEALAEWLGNQSMET